MPPAGRGASVPDVAIVSASGVCPRVLNGKTFSVPRKRDAARASFGRERILKVNGQRRRATIFMAFACREQANRNLNKRVRNRVSIRESGRSAGNQGDWHLTPGSNALAKGRVVSRQYRQCTGTRAFLGGARVSRVGDRSRTFRKDCFGERPKDPWATQRDLKRWSDGVKE